MIPKMNTLLWGMHFIVFQSKEDYYICDSLDRVPLRVKMGFNNRKMRKNIEAWGLEKIRCVCVCVCMHMCVYLDSTV